MLAHIDGQDLVMVELGVYVGANLVSFFAPSGKFAVYHGVDKWDRGLRFGGTTLKHPNGEAVWAEFQQNIEGLPLEVIPHRCGSVLAAEQFEDASVDFVYIDTTHAYIQTKLEIRAWWPKVKPGGYLGGHDYTSGRQQVKMSVDERFPNALVFGGECWLIQKHVPVAQMDRARDS